MNILTHRSIHCLWKLLHYKHLISQWLCLFKMYLHIIFGKNIHYFYLCYNEWFIFHNLGGLQSNNILDTVFDLKSDLWSKSKRFRNLSASVLIFALKCLYMQTHSFTVLSLMEKIIKCYEIVLPWTETFSFIPNST